MQNEIQAVKQMAYYKDLREHIKALEASNKLVRIRKEIKMLQPLYSNGITVL